MGLFRWWYYRKEFCFKIKNAKVNLLDLMEDFVNHLHNVISRVCRKPELGYY